MAEVTLDSGVVGAGIVLAADALFYMVKGTTDLSTDGGTTYIPFDSGTYVHVTSGLTVTPRGNTGSNGSTFRHMSI